MNGAKFAFQKRAGRPLAMRKSLYAPNGRLASDAATRRNAGEADRLATALLTAPHNRKRKKA